MGSAKRIAYFAVWTSASMLFLCTGFVYAQGGGATPAAAAPAAGADADAATKQFCALVANQNKDCSLKGKKGKCQAGDCRLTGAPEGTQATDINGNPVVSPSGTLSPNATPVPPTPQPGFVDPHTGAQYAGPSPIDAFNGKPGETNPEPPKPLWKQAWEYLTEPSSTVIPPDPLVPAPSPEYSGNAGDAGSLQPTGNPGNPSNPCSPNGCSGVDPVPDNTFGSPTDPPPTEPKNPWYKNAYDYVSEKFSGFFAGNPSPDESPTALERFDGPPAAAMLPPAYDFNAPPPVIGYDGDGQPIYQNPSSPNPHEQPDRNFAPSDPLRYAGRAPDYGYENETMPNELRAYQEEAARAADALREKQKALDAVVAQRNKVIEEMDAILRKGTYSTLEKKWYYISREEAVKFEALRASANEYTAQIKGQVASLQSDFAAYKRDFLDPAYTQMGDAVYGPRREAIAAMADYTAMQMASPGPFYDSLGRKFDTYAAALVAENATTRINELGPQLHDVNQRIEALKAGKFWVSLSNAYAADPTTGATLTKAEYDAQLKYLEGAKSYINGAIQLDGALSRSLEVQKDYVLAFQRPLDPAIITEKMSSISQRLSINPLDPQALADQRLLTQQISAWDSATQKVAEFAGPLGPNALGPSAFVNESTRTELAHGYGMNADQARGRILEIAGVNPKSPELLLATASLTKDLKDYTAYTDAVLARDGPQNNLTLQLLGKENFDYVTSRTLLYGQNGFDAAQHFFEKTAADNLRWSEGPAGWFKGAGAMILGGTTGNVAEFLGVPTTARALDLVNYTSEGALISRTVAGAMAGADIGTFWYGGIGALRTLGKVENLMVDTAAGFRALGSMESFIADRMSTAYTTGTNATRLLEAADTLGLSVAQRNALTSVKVATLGGEDLATGIVTRGAFGEYGQALQGLDRAQEIVTTNFWGGARIAEAVPEVTSAATRAVNAARLESRAYAELQQLRNQFRAADYDRLLGSSADDLASARGFGFDAGAGTRNPIVPVPGGGGFSGGQAFNAADSLVTEAGSFGSTVTDLAQTLAKGVSPALGAAPSLATQGLAAAFGREAGAFSEAAGSVLAPAAGDLARQAPVAAAGSPIVTGTLPTNSAPNILNRLSAYYEGVGGYSVPASIDVAAVPPTGIAARPPLPSGAAAPTPPVGGATPGAATVVPPAPGVTPSAPVGGAALPGSIPGAATIPSGFFPRVASIWNAPAGAFASPVSFAGALGSAAVRDIAGAGLNSLNSFRGLGAQGTNITGAVPGTGAAPTGLTQTPSKLGGAGGLGEAAGGPAVFTPPPKPPCPVAIDGASRLAASQLAAPCLVNFARNLTLNDLKPSNILPLARNMSVAVRTDLAAAAPRGFVITPQRGLGLGTEVPGSPTTPFLTYSSEGVRINIPANAASQPLSPFALDYGRAPSTLTTGTVPPQTGNLTPAQITQGAPVPGSGTTLGQPVTTARQGVQPFFQNGVSNIPPSNALVVTRPPSLPSRVYSGAGALIAESFTALGVPTRVALTIAQLQLAGIDVAGLAARGLAPMSLSDAIHKALGISRAQAQVPRAGVQLPAPGTLVKDMTDAQITALIEDTVAKLNAFWSDYFISRGATFKPITIVTTGESFSYHRAVGSQQKLSISISELRDVAVASPGVTREVVEYLAAHEFGHAVPHQLGASLVGILKSFITSTQELALAGERQATWLAGFSLSRSGIVPPANMAKVVEGAGAYGSAHPLTHPGSVENSRIVQSGVQTAQRGGGFDEAFTTYAVPGTQVRGITIAPATPAAPPLESAPGVFGRTKEIWDSATKSTLNSTPVGLIAELGVAMVRDLADAGIAAVRGLGGAARTEATAAAILNKNVPSGAQQALKAAPFRVYEPRIADIVIDGLRSEVAAGDLAKAASQRVVVDALIRSGKVTDVRGIFDTVPTAFLQNTNEAAVAAIVNREVRFALEGALQRSMTPAEEAFLMQNPELWSAMYPSLKTPANFRKFVTDAIEGRDALIRVEKSPDNFEELFLLKPANGDLRLIERIPASGADAWQVASRDVPVGPYLRETQVTLRDPSASILAQESAAAEVARTTVETRFVGANLSNVLPTLEKLGMTDMATALQAQRHSIVARLSENGVFHGHESSAGSTLFTHDGNLTVEFALRSDIDAALTAAGRPPLSTNATVGEIMDAARIINSDTIPVTQSLARGLSDPDMIPIVRLRDWGDGTLVQPQNLAVLPQNTQAITKAAVDALAAQPVSATRAVELARAERALTNATEAVALYERGDVAASFIKAADARDLMRSNALGINPCAVAMGSGSSLAMSQLAATCIGDLAKTLKADDLKPGNLGNVARAVGDAVRADVVGPSRAMAAAGQSPSAIARDMLLGRTREQIVRNVAYNPQLEKLTGDGNIAFLRGTMGSGGFGTYGLTHVAGKHPAIIQSLDKLLLNGSVSANKRGSISVRLGGEIAFIGTTWNGEKINWLITAYRISSTKESPAVLAKVTGDIKTLRTAKQGEVTAVANNANVGKIDVMYGNWRSGLASIDSAVDPYLPELLAYGKPVNTDPLIVNGRLSTTNPGASVIIETKNARGVVRLNYEGEPRAWLYTAEIKKGPQNVGSPNTASGGTSPVGADRLQAPTVAEAPRTGSIPNNNNLSSQGVPNTDIVRRSGFDALNKTVDAIRSQLAPITAQPSGPVQFLPRGDSTMSVYINGLDMGAGLPQGAKFVPSDEYYCAIASGCIGVNVSRAQAPEFPIAILHERGHLLGSQADNLNANTLRVHNEFRTTLAGVRSGEIPYLEGQAALRQLMGERVALTVASEVDAWQSALREAVPFYRQTGINPLERIDGIPRTNSHGQPVRMTAEQEIFNALLSHGMMNNIFKEVQLGQRATAELIALQRQAYDRAIEVLRQDIANARTALAQTNPVVPPPLPATNPNYVDRIATVLGRPPEAPWYGSGFEQSMGLRGGPVAQSAPITAPRTISLLSLDRAAMEAVMSVQGINTAHYSKILNAQTAVREALIPFSDGTALSINRARTEAFIELARAEGLLATRHGQLAENIAGRMPLSDQKIALQELAARSNIVTKEYTTAAQGMNRVLNAGQRATQYMEPGAVTAMLKGFEDQFAVARASFEAFEADLARTLKVPQQAVTTNPCTIALGGTSDLVASQLAATCLGDLARGLKMGDLKPGNLGALARNVAGAVRADVGSFVGIRPAVGEVMPVRGLISQLRAGGAEVERALGTTPLDPNLGKSAVTNGTGLSSVPESIQPPSAAQAIQRVANVGQAVTPAAVPNMVQRGIGAVRDFWNSSRASGSLYGEGSERAYETFVRKLSTPDNAVVESATGSGIRQVTEVRPDFISPELWGRLRVAVEDANFSAMKELADELNRIVVQSPVAQAQINEAVTGLGKAADILEVKVPEARTSDAINKLTAGAIYDGQSAIDSLVKAGETVRDATAGVAQLRAVENATPPSASSRAVSTGNTNEAAQLAETLKRQINRADIEAKLDLMEVQRRPNNGNFVLTQKEFQAAQAAEFEAYQNALSKMTPGERAMEEFAGVEGVRAERELRGTLTDEFRDAAEKYRLAQANRERQVKLGSSAEEAFAELEQQQWSVSREIEQLGVAQGYRDMSGSFVELERKVQELRKLMTPAQIEQAIREGGYQGVVANGNASLRTAYNAVSKAADDAYQAGNMKVAVDAALSPSAGSVTLPQGWSSGTEKMTLGDLVRATSQKASSLLPNPLTAVRNLVGATAKPLEQIKGAMDAVAKPLAGIKGAIDAMTKPVAGIKSAVDAAVNRVQGIQQNIRGYVADRRAASELTKEIVEAEARIDAARASLSQLPEGANPARVIAEMRVISAEEQALDMLRGAAKDFDLARRVPYGDRAALTEAALSKVETGAAIQDNANIIRRELPAAEMPRVEVPVEVPETPAVVPAATGELPVVPEQASANTRAIVPKGYPVITTLDLENFAAEIGSEIGLARTLHNIESARLAVLEEGAGATPAKLLEDQAAIIQNRAAELTSLENTKRELEAAAATGDKTARINAINRAQTELARAIKLRAETGEMAAAVRRAIADSEPLSPASGGNGGNAGNGGTGQQAGGNNNARWGGALFGLFGNIRTGVQNWWRALVPAGITGGLLYWASGDPSVQGNPPQQTNKPTLEPAPDEPEAPQQPTPPAAKPPPAPVKLFTPPTTKPAPTPPPPPKTKPTPKPTPTPTPSPSPSPKSPPSPSVTNPFSGITPLLSSLANLQRLLSVVNPSLLNSIYSFFGITQPQIATSLTVSLTADPSSIAASSTSQLTWSAQGASTCALFGPGAKRTVLPSAFGSTSTPSLTKSTEFAILCFGNNAYGQSIYGTASTVVEVAGSGSDVVRAQVPSNVEIQSALMTGSFSTYGLQQQGSLLSPGVNSSLYNSQVNNPNGTQTNQNGIPSNEAPVAPPVSGYLQDGKTQVSAYCAPNQPMDSFIQCLCRTQAGGCKPWQKY